MFSRLRMSPIAEIQGSDWDRLRLIAASGAAQKLCRSRSRSLTGVQFRTIDSSHDWIQLPAWWVKKTQLS